MRLTRFQELVNDEFGADFAPIVLRDTRMTELSDQTPQQALDAGTDPAEVWAAIVKHHQVPKEFWQGRPRPASTKQQKT